MRHFHCMADGVDVSALAYALHANPGIWNRNALRREYPGTPHRECDDIWLRFQPEGMPADQVVDAHESINYPAFAELPAARSIVFALMRQVEGERLGRVLITRLAPGRRIYPHVDGGDHAAYYKRHHVMVRCLPGVVFRAADEAPTMKTGDVWWFDNSVEHEVVNNSADDRIALIVDIRPC